MIELEEQSVQHRIDAHWFQIRKQISRSKRSNLDFYLFSYLRSNLFITLCHSIRDYLEEEMK
jgi:hypothetical protein